MMIKGLQPFRPVSILTSIALTIFQGASCDLRLILLANYAVTLKSNCLLSTRCVLFYPLLQNSDLVYPLIPNYLSLLIEV